MAYTRFDDAFLRFVIMYTMEEKFRRPGEVFVSIDKMIELVQYTITSTGGGGNGSAG